MVSEKEMTMNYLTESSYDSMYTCAVYRAASKQKRNYLLCHIPIDKTNDLAYSAAVTLKVFDDDRPTDEKATSERVLLIRAWENKLKTNFDGTASFLSALDQLSRGSTHNKDIGAKLRRIRRRRRWTQEQMAVELGVDRSLFSRIERGERNIPESVVDWMKNRGKKP
uniref:Putative DNA binding, helix-turn-helix domain containing protein n=1 Tax=viral metagenome TaxID=1070528 RepID=A0A6H1ZKF3_9ZZZZ